jgi:hypothetical protein
MAVVYQLSARFFRELRPYLPPQTAEPAVLGAAEEMMERLGRRHRAAAARP